MILVIADSLRGQVDSAAPPVLELNAEDIASYGAGSITELLEALAPQTGSGRGRGGGGGPAILVNGARVSSFREIASFPPEAIDRIEVLPEEVALRYGFSADQRVVNFILKRNYSSREIELGYGQPWDGGYSSQEIEATILRISGPGRMNFNVEWEPQSSLTEAERGVIQTPGTVSGLPGDPDPALYRTLQAESRQFQATGNYSSRIGDSGTTFSVNGNYQRSTSTRLQGLDTVLLTDPDGNSVLRTFNADDPLHVDSTSDTFSAGGSINAMIGDWQIVGTVDGSHVDSVSRIERRADVSGIQEMARLGLIELDAALEGFVADAGYDQAITRSDTATSKVTANGQPLLLPGGFVSLTFDAGYDWTQIRSRDTRNDNVETSLVRGNLNAGVNLAVPITSVREDFLAAVGDLTFNFSGGVDHLSDFGTLTDWTAGFTWSPVETLSFQVSRINREQAPSLSQLGNPEIATFNVPVFDLSRGETVLATTISGGNPDLPAQSQRDWKFGVYWELPTFVDFIERGRVQVEYFRNRSNDIATGFPVLTPTIEAAFPGRVIRDADGRLVSIDQRPVTLFSQDVERLQIGLNLNGPLGRAFTPEQQERAQANNPMAQAFRAMAPGGQGGSAVGPNGPAAPGAQPGQPPQGGFNPQVFMDLRAKFCTPENESAVPTAADLAALPEPLRARMIREDGTVDPAAWAEMRTRLCSAEPGMGPGGGNFDPERFARLRQQFCNDRSSIENPSEELLAQLPEQLVTRLRRPDGTIDPELWKTFRDRVCSASPQGGPPAQGQGQGQGQPQGGPPPGGMGPGGPGGPPPGGFRGPGGGGGFRGPGGGGGDGRGRWFFNINYTRELSNEVLVAPGGPLLDLLDGDALSGGGQPVNAFTVSGGMFYRGFGGRYSLRYTGESRINGSGLPGSTDLFFDDFMRLDLRVFADLNQRTSLVEAAPIFRDTRISLGIDNVFDERQRVVDSTGTVPLRYQPFLVDPVGRFVSLELRKMF